ncbi:MAG: hypothetical protein DRH37_08815 [Deltaproteobacteria bacterium]|nr:MAG: hypothetical protein DRH37_08815 [Deltaproteobacteria bacterium]
MDIKKKQENFIHGLIVWATINAALQRSNTYGEFSPNDKRWNMRVYMQSQLEEITQEYKDEVDDKKHMKNISVFANAISAEHGSILKDGRFRIGIAQKALNLYLKYMWCQGKIGRPPHCPFDGIVINELRQLDKNAEYRWTKSDSISDYRKWVEAAKKEAGDMSLAEWELNVWEKGTD